MRGNARAFTQEELMQFGVADLAPDHYVQVGGRYYQPEEGTPLEALAERYLILKGLTDGLFKRLLPWVNLNEADIPHSVAHEVSSLRARLFWERKEPFFRDALKATRTDVRRELLKSFNLNRRKAIEAREQAEAGRETPAGEQQPPLTIFQQIGAQLFKEATTPAERLWALVELNRTHRTNEGGSRSASTSLAFSVRFEGELGQDEGGPFRETLETFAAELTAPPLQLLVPVPNGRKDVNGQYEEKGGDVWGRDRYMLNPAVPSAERLRDFELMGAFMGVAIRSEVPLPLVLASTLLKGLVGEPTTLDDYELCDKAKTDLIRRVREALPSLEIGASPLGAGTMPHCALPPVFIGYQKPFFGKLLLIPQPPPPILHHEQSAHPLPKCIGIVLPRPAESRRSSSILSPGDRHISTGLRPALQHPERPVSEACRSGLGIWLWDKAWSCRCTSLA
jgi:hypothetical protein